MSLWWKSTRFVALLCVAGGLTGCWGGDDGEEGGGGATTTSDAQLPVEIKVETQTFLAGPGQPLTSVRDQAAPLVSAPPEALTDGCAGVIAALPPDVDLISLTAEVPDPVLAERLLNEYSALFDALSACRSGDVAEAQTFLDETGALRVSTNERLEAVRS